MFSILAWRGTGVVASSEIRMRDVGLTLVQLVRPDQAMVNPIEFGFKSCISFSE